MLDEKIQSQEQASLPMVPRAEEKRIRLIDIARFYAIALVYYGHFIERIMLLNNPAAAVSV